MARKSNRQQDKDAAKADSKHCAVLATRSPALAAQAMQGYSGFQNRVSLQDMVDELRLVGNEIADGNMRRVEQMLATQAILLDSIFANLMCRADRCETMKPMEVYMRLALKAQAQARATAESLAILKNPQPYIRQTNIAAGHQQINNSYATASVCNDARAGDSELVPSKLLEVTDEQRLDLGAPAAAGRSDQDMAAMGSVYRAKK